MGSTLNRTFAEIPNLDSYIEQVDRELESILRVGNDGLNHSALRLVRGGGKRLRPALVIAAALSQGGKVGREVIGAGAAIELAHIATLVHDDIIDNADTRWGVPTVNRREGVDNAILVGDYLLTLSAAQAAGVSGQVAYVLSAAIAEVCVGQAQEMSDNFNLDRSVESYLAAIRLKTAALTAAACRIGGLCADLPHKKIEALARYGEAFGTAFQLLDDIMDFTSTTKTMGKPVGNDVKEGVYTMPLILSLHGPSRNLIKTWLGKGPVTRATHSKITKILLADGTIKATLSEVRKYNKVASTSLRLLDSNDITTSLSKLPAAYMDWAISAAI